MCNGKCRECRRLKVPCRTINDHFTAYCFECDRFGMQGNSAAEVYPAVLEEIADAKEDLKRMGKAWTVEWHGKAITAEAERQEDNMENISYTVVGFADAKKVATYHKDGLTKIGANRVANRLYRSGDFELVDIREEVEAPGYSESGIIKEIR